MLTHMSETRWVVDGLFDADGLIGGACGACDRRHFPLAGWCPWCGAAEPSEARLSSEGTVWACTTVNAAPPGYEGPVPFGFGVVGLPDDGLQVITLLAEHDTVRVGDAVRFAPVTVGDGVSSWGFEPAGSPVDGAGR
jgi:uncharacterized OB-fold protein